MSQTVSPTLTTPLPVAEAPVSVQLNVLDVLIVTRQDGNLKVYSSVDGLA